MFDDFIPENPAGTPATVSNLLAFFRGLWNALARTIQLLISIPSLIFTSVVGLTAGMVNFISFCIGVFNADSPQFSYVQNLVNTGSEFIANNIASNDWLQVACYILNAKSFAACFFALPVLILGVMYAFLQYVVTVLLPVLLGIIVYRIGIKIAKAIAPRGYTPCLEIDVPMLEEVYGGNPADWDFVQ